MSAQYLLNVNATDQFEIISDGSDVVEAPADDLLDASSQTKQREALYYIVAVITFYALTFLILFCKYARFKKKEFEDTYPYFPLPPDPKGTEAAADDFLINDAGADDVDPDMRGGRSRDVYGSTGVTPKVMRVKLLQHWMCRGDQAKSCDV